MVLASVDVPPVLDPMDGCPYSMNGGYQKDADAAVAGLQSAVASVRAWLDSLMGGISDETKEQP
jgi:hypothetical protein